MTVPVLPESAPFSPAQRAWLNGFFAGLLSMGEDGPARAAGPAQALAPILALSRPSGPANGAGTAPPPEETFPWHDPNLSLEERLRLAEGKPLERTLMAAMAQLDCGACGYLCKTYAEAIAGGSERSLTLCAPGGKATAAKLKEILARARATPIAPAVTAAAPVPAPGRAGPRAARVIRSTRLNREGSEKETRHVVLDISGSGLAYHPGDSLGIHPLNCPDLVEEVLRASRLNGEEPVAVGDEETPLREALLSRRDVNCPSEELLGLLSRSASDPAEAGALRRLLEGEGEDPLSGREVIDLLEEFPSARPSPAELIAALAPLRPRLYSISSSLRAHPGEVHLTVSVVRYRNRGRTRKGVASTFLADRIVEGREVRVFVQPSRGFRLPPSGSTPIIMVGPGTGIAPFRAFLEERKAAGADGRNWLFFGEQREALDFLYREEIEDFLREGLLTRLDVAFSRDQTGKVYVQHRLLEKCAEVWTWLEEGAHFYVCGDARRMASDVDAALREAVSRGGGLSAEAARRYVEDLARAGRYQRDVY
jgi:sulfite reductase (NADPH) flavoprotein alpha-component